MRYREKTLGSGRMIPEIGQKESMQMWDDASASRHYKRMDFSKAYIREDLPWRASLSYKVYYSHDSEGWHWRWSEPTTLGSGSSSITGQGVMYAWTGVPAGVSFPEVQSGIIYNSMKNYGKSDLNLGTTLGELRETIEMFRRPWDIARHLARGDIKIPKWIKNVPDAVAHVSSAYLGYRYGVRPFLSDVRGVCRTSERLSQRLRVRDSSEPMTLRSTHSLSETATSSGRRAPDYGYAHQVDYKNTVTVTTTRCEFCQVVSNPSVEAMGIARQFANTYHLDDIAGIAWELTPYSFIVDWFLPVGDMIASVAGAPGVIHACSSPWYWEKKERVISVSNSGYDTPDYHVGFSLGYTYCTESFTRQPLVVFPPKPVDIDGWQKLDLALIAGQTMQALFGNFRR